MVQARRSDNSLERLRVENERLRAENRRLQRTNRHLAGRRWLRSAGVVCLAALAILVLTAGNLLFWGSSTAVDNDRFNRTVAPIIRKSSVQKAAAAYTTAQLYDNVDVAAYIQNALPPRAEFLAPSIAAQLRSYVQTTLTKLAANPKFQDSWNETLGRAHARFIDAVRQSGGDGTIDLNELYRQLSGSLKDTRLGFLADRDLPPKAGRVQVASGSGIKALHTVVVHIDAWRILAGLLFLLCAALAIWLARFRRRLVVAMSLIAAACLLAALVALHIVCKLLTDRVSPQYRQAVRDVFRIVLHPLVVRTTTIVILLLLVALAAWLTGGTRSARYLQAQIRRLPNGKHPYR